MSFNHVHSKADVHDWDRAQKLDQMSPVIQHPIQFGDNIVIEILKILIYRSSGTFTHSSRRTQARVVNNDELGTRQTRRQCEDKEKTSVYTTQ